MTGTPGEGGPPSSPEKEIPTENRAFQEVNQAFQGLLCKFFSLFFKIGSTPRVEPITGLKLKILRLRLWCSID